MMTFVAVVHILIALLLITLVLLQDSKGGGASGVLGGAGANSLLGATGATTLLEKLTRYMAIGFAITCILLTVMSAQKNASVLDSYVAPPAAPAPASPNAAPAAPGASGSTQAAPSGTSQK